MRDPAGKMIWFWIVDTLLFFVPFIWFPLKRSFEELLFVPRSWL
jgi:hypothetical protein